MKGLEHLAIKDMRLNICQTCAYATRQDDGALVDCNYLDDNSVISDAYRLDGECSAYHPNQHLLNMKTTAIDAIHAFEQVAAKEDARAPQSLEVCDAAARACALQEAYAIITGIGYDMAATILHEDAQRNGNAGNTLS